MAGQRRSASNPPSSPVSTARCRCGRPACRANRSRRRGPGALPREQIEAALGAPLEAAPPDSVDPEAPLAPGMMESHYAPRAKLRLRADRVNEGEALLAFGPRLPPGAEHASVVLNLSPGGDLVEAAANLFSDLRTLDRSEVAMIAVMPVPDEGLGEAINDRLARAAA